MLKLTGRIERLNISTELGRNASDATLTRNDAYGEAVKAIEVAAKPVVTPDDPLATLGKMISAIRDEPGKWETDAEFDGGVQTILAMMKLAWKGQLRHGDENAPIDVSQEAAEMTVQDSGAVGELVPVGADSSEGIALLALTGQPLETGTSTAALA